MDSSALKAKSRTGFLIPVANTGEAFRVFDIVGLGGYGLDRTLLTYHGDSSLSFQRIGLAISSSSDWVCDTLPHFHTLPKSEYQSSTHPPS